ncbi:hypothetical protein F5Y04DRAFT_293335 [Hypomontagnella monticulosa]|nr:hypothetical protein F5Y04DRAFT_293335 [Hypomontagnella monticulosa]
MAVNKRIPLPTSRPRKQKPPDSPATPPVAEELAKSLPAKRKRGKVKAITSCERCRQAHIKCVSRGPGESCQNCAKRSISTCSFTKFSHKTDGGSTANKDGTDSYSPQAQRLQAIAASAVEYMERQLG